MTTAQIIETIKEACTKYGFTAKEEGQIVKLYNRGSLAGVIASGEAMTMERKFAGQKTLMGSLVRNDINTAIRNAGGTIQSVN